MWLKKFLIVAFNVIVASNLFANTTMKPPTLVLVHGALLTSNIWGPVQSYLQNHHVNVVTLDVPGRLDDNISAKDADLELAAKKVCTVVNMQYGPVILVGHSQGGAIINQAINECGEKVKALVYIAAVVPLNGEKPYDLLSQTDGENFDLCTNIDHLSGLYQVNYNGPIKEMFMDDVSAEKSSRAIATMVPEPIIIGEKPLHFSNAVFEAIPKFYIKTTNDKIISPATQEKFLNRVKFIQTFELPTSHSPFLAEPKKVGEILNGIVDSLSTSLIKRQ